MRAAGTLWSIQLLHQTAHMESVRGEDELSLILITHSQHITDVSSGSATSDGYLGLFFKMYKTNDRKKN